MFTEAVTILNYNYFMTIVQKLKGHFFFFLRDSYA